MKTLEQIAWAIAQAKDPQWLGDEEGRTKTCLPLARAAIMAMYDPSEHAKAAGRMALKTSDAASRFELAGDVFERMLDAILNE